MRRSGSTFGAMDSQLGAPNVARASEPNQDSSNLAAIIERAISSAVGVGSIFPPPEHTCGMCMRESRARFRKPDHHEQPEAQSASRTCKPRRAPRTPAVCSPCHTFFFEQIKRFQQLSGGQTPLERNGNNHCRAFADFFETMMRSRAFMRCEPDRVSRMLGYLAWKLKVHKVIKFPRPGARSSSPSPSPLLLLPLEPLPARPQQHLLQLASFQASGLDAPTTRAAAAPMMVAAAQFQQQQQQQQHAPRPPHHHHHVQQPPRGEWAPMADTPATQKLAPPPLMLHSATYGVGAVAPAMVMASNRSIAALMGKPMLSMDQWALAFQQQQQPWKHPLVQQQLLQDQQQLLQQLQQQPAMVGLTLSMPSGGTGFLGAAVP